MLFVASVLGLDGESGEGDSAAAAAGAAFFPAGLRPRLRFILLCVCVCVCVCVFFFSFFGLTNRDGSSGAGEERAAKSTGGNKHSNLRLGEGGEEFPWNGTKRS